MEKILAYNHKAKYKYRIYNVIECGLILKSTEIKPIKKKHVNILNSYIIFKKNEIFIVKLKIFHISETQMLSYSSASKTRKIIAHRKEILYLYKEHNKKGTTLIPTKIIEKRGWIKLIIGCACINQNMMKLYNRKAKQNRSLSTYETI